MPVWWDEPDAVLGVNLQKGFVLAGTEGVAIAVRRLVAYLTGLSIGMVAVARTWGGFPESRGRHPFGWGESESENDLQFGLPPRGWHQGGVDFRLSLPVGVTAPL
jgi:hypothetical protein